MRQPAPRSGSCIGPARSSPSWHRARAPPRHRQRVCYRVHDFATVLRGARHQRITRHSGKVERYNRILSEEFLYAYRPKLAMRMAHLLILRALA